MADEAQPDAVTPVQNPPQQHAEGSEKRKKKRKKRVRGQKVRIIHVIHAGEEPSEKRLKGGKVRDMNILRRNYDSDKMPRKTRDLIQRMAAFNGDKMKKDPTIAEKTDARAGGKADLKPTPVSTDNADAVEHNVTEAALPENGSKTVEGEDEVKVHSEHDKKQKASDVKKFEKMQPGENFAQYSARLRRQSKKAILEAAKKENHQREKKRAYYEKRRERAERRKRRRRGDCSDEDAADDNGGEDEDFDDSLSRMPLYWQEIVQNNGRPLTEKTRRRLRRKEEGEKDEVSFGDRVERPPQFSSVPAQRSR